MDSEYSSRYDAIRKGKCRAIPNDTNANDASERTPLLANDTLIQDDPPAQSRLRNLFHGGNEGDGENSSTTVSRRRTFPLILLGVFCGTLILTLLGLVILAALARASSIALKNVLADPELQETLSKEALVIAGPLRVDILNATATNDENETVVWVKMDMRLGIDGGRVVTNVLDALEDYNYDGQQNRKGWIPPWSAAVRRWKENVGRWAVGRLGHISAATSDIALYASTTTGFSSANNSAPLFDVKIPPITIPLSSNFNISAADDLSWLTSLSIPVRISVTPIVSDIEDFIRESWTSGVADVRLFLPTVTVNGGGLGEQTWRRWLRFEEGNIAIQLKQKVPPIPGLPNPGSGEPLPPLASLITLQSFTVTADQQTHKVQIRANATFVNPLQRQGIIGDDFRVIVPSLDFVVSLPNTTTPNGDNVTRHDDSIVVAIGETDPFALVPSIPSSPSNITASMQAHVPALPSSSTPLISFALSQYLSAQPIPIIISSPVLPSYALPFLFPAPPERPQLLRDVMIRDVRVSLKGEAVLASGEVIARVVLPGEGKIRVGVEAKRVWPDVLVFDGDVPEEGEGEEGELLFSMEEVSGNLPSIPTLPIPLPTFNIPFPMPKLPNHHDGEDPSPTDHSKIPKPPLPTPLPPRAFARIRPEDWLDARSVPLPDVFPPPKHNRSLFPFHTSSSEYDFSKSHPQPAYQYLVTSRFTDVPLEVLPGREALLRKFVTKVVFGGEGAVAGVKGVAGVAASVEGVALGGNEDGSEIELTGIPVQGSFRVGKKVF